MNIRQEVEVAVANFASAQTPTITVAYEGVAFTKPNVAPYLEIVFLNSIINNATVDATRARLYGAFQINVYVPDGRGMKMLDDLSTAVASLFPVYNKERYTTFSVEKPPNISPALVDAGFRWVAVRVNYRQEQTLIQ